MKQAIQPAYGVVAFRDRSVDATFLTRSTFVGRPAEDPLSEGRVEQLNRRFGIASAGQRSDR